MTTSRLWDYVCRRCGAVRRATIEEVEFGRVLCACGGTCDPSDETLSHLDARRDREDKLTSPVRGPAFNPLPAIAGGAEKER